MGQHPELNSNHARIQAALPGVSDHLYFWSTDVFRSHLLLLALALVIGVLSPLLFHVVYADEERHLRGGRAWRWILVEFYTVSIGAALAKGLDDSELIATRWTDQLNNAPALMLGL